MKSSLFAAFILFIATLLLSFTAPAHGVSQAGRQHRNYMQSLREQRQRNKDSKLAAMGRTRWEIRQQRRDARRFGA